MRSTGEAPLPHFVENRCTVVWRYISPGASRVDGKLG
jgi:hypothetical protein